MPAPVLTGCEAIIAYTSLRLTGGEAIPFHASMASVFNAGGIDFLGFSRCVDFPKCLHFKRWPPAETKRIAHWKLFHTKFINLR